MPGTNPFPDTPSTGPFTTGSTVPVSDGLDWRDRTTSGRLILLTVPTPDEARAAYDTKQQRLDELDYEAAMTRVRGAIDASEGGRKPMFILAPVRPNAREAVIQALRSRGWEVRRGFDRIHFASPPEHEAAPTEVAPTPNTGGDAPDLCP